MHVLFVDDNVETRDLFQLCFTLAGHQCDVAKNGRMAVQIINRKTAPFDIVIIDYHMPDVDGLQVVHQLRQIDNLPAVPIILFTGDKSGTIQSQAQELGVALVLYKPVVPTELLADAQTIVREHLKAAGISRRLPQP